MHRAIAFTLILLGMVVTAYPVGETYVNDRHTAQHAASYVNEVAVASEQSLTAQLQAAHAYNTALQPDVLADPWSYNRPSTSAQHSDYLVQLNEFDAMARLRIPRIGVDLPIYHDATQPSLAKGVGHMYGTSLPVGGRGTHAVLAGHTGARTTFFDHLGELRGGDNFMIDVYGETLTYRVDATTVVDPADLSSIRPVPEADYVTLVTCVNNGARRLLVRGIRVPDVAVAPSAGSTPQAAMPPVKVHATVQPWMAPRLVIASAALLAIIVMALSWVRADRHREPSAPAKRAEAVATGSLVESSAEATVEPSVASTTEPSTKPSADLVSKPSADPATNPANDSSTDQKDATP